MHLRPRRVDGGEVGVVAEVVGWTGAEFVDRGT